MSLTSPKFKVGDKVTYKGGRATVLRKDGRKYVVRDQYGYPREASPKELEKFNG